MKTRVRQPIGDYASASRYELILELDFLRSKIEHLLDVIESRDRNERMKQRIFDKLRVTDERSPKAPAES